MNDRRYMISTFLFALLTPFLISLCCIAAIFVQWLALLLSISMILFLWSRRAKREDLPADALHRYLPILLAFSYYMLLWFGAMSLSHLSFDSPLLGRASLLSAPFFGPLAYFSFIGDYTWYPALVAAAFALMTAGLALGCLLRHRRSTGLRGGLSLFFIAVILCGGAGWQAWQRSLLILDGDFSSLQQEEEVDLLQYQPFQADSLLASLGEPSTLAIHADYPRLDGATAAYPVYAAVAETVYQGLTSFSVGDYVQCNKTTGGYERLIAGECDVFFGAQPSQQQLALAEQQGVTLQTTPIAKEAFVFFVNRENPVDSLTLEEIQAIYQRKIRNWKRVGGKDERILAFQRPENSGSQTIMLAKVMQGKKLPEPLRVEYAEGMGGVISGVAAYRNDSSSIGYSFRYFATGMKPNDEIKLLAVDGVAPTVENIRSGAYPFTVDVYAVTTGGESPNTKALLDWLQSPQGRRLIEASGYVAAG